jgi:hypothetical protein
MDLSSLTDQAVIIALYTIDKAAGGALEKASADVLDFLKSRFRGRVSIDQAKQNKELLEAVIVEEARLDQQFKNDLERLVTQFQQVQSVELANAKAFESGRVLMGTYVELLRDEQYDCNDILERVSVYLADIGVKSVNLNFVKSSISYEDFREGMQSINNQLWGKGGKLGHYFEVALHLFIAIPPDKSERFYQLVGELDLPKGVIKEDKSVLENFAEIRYYFEKIIFS